MGMDQLDSDKRYATLLKKFKPGGISNFRQAYAYGIGLMLDFNKEYIMTHDVNKVNFKEPEYLHIVIGSESDNSEKPCTQN